LGFREATVLDGNELVTWLAEQVLSQEHRADHVREALFERCRALRIEPPSVGRIDRLIRSAFNSFEERWCASVFDQLGAASQHAHLRLALRLAEKLGALTLAARVVDRLHQHGPRRASPRPRASTSNKRGAPPLSGLSRREGQLAILVAQAYTNREIDERLIVSERDRGKARAKYSEPPRAAVARTDRCVCGSARRRG